MVQHKRMYRVTKKKSKRKKIAALLLLPLLILMVGATTYGAFLYNKAENVITDSYDPLKSSAKRETIVDPGEDNISILFLGVDDSEQRDYKESARTDALIFATFNLESKSVKLLSIPRDSYVYIPEKDTKSKINHAHAYGGVSATVETVEELLDVPVDYYVKMNFQAFIEVIDALGGIEMDVPYKISEKDSNDQSNSIKLKPGIQKLDGEEALALARTRKQDNDIERGKRQQEIIKAIVKEASSVKAITKYADLMEAVGDNMKTNLTFSEMKSFIEYATAGSNLSIESLNLEGEDSTIDGIYYYELDDESVEETKSTLKNHLEVKGSITETQSASPAVEEE